MALSAAAQRKAKKGPTGQYYGKEKYGGLIPKGYKVKAKGKYFGPEKYQGKNQKYKAPATSASGTQPTEPTSPTAPTGPQSVYNPNSTVSNGSGLISLQSTHDLNMQELEAQDARDQEVLAADQAEKEAEIRYNDVNGTEVLALNKQRRSDKGQLNSSLAYRGLTRGSTAAQKLTEMGEKHDTTSIQIAAQRKLAKDSATAARLAADTTLAGRKRAITLARENYTIGASADSPTEGSQAEDSGVNPTTTPAPAAAAAPVAAAAASKWKGKYRGPDRFKGDPKKLAAWRKAGRPKK